MSPRQTLAITYPFARAGGSLRRFTQRHKKHVTALTVNKWANHHLGRPVPVWHVSISTWSNGGMLKPVRDLSLREVLRACSLGDALLIGVGDGRRAVAFTRDPPADCIHIQKPLTEKEIAILDPAWLALPAVDDLGAIRLLSVDAVRKESW
jgi:hypothetical protein